MINDITLENGLERHQVKKKCRSILSKELKETHVIIFGILKNSQL